MTLKFTNCTLTALLLVLPSSIAAQEDDGPSAQWFIDDAANWPPEVADQWSELDSADRTYIVNRLANRKIPAIADYMSNYKREMHDVVWIDAVFVNQVAGPESMLARYGDDNFWIEGVSTTNVVDDRVFKWDPPVLARNVGTKTYTTVIGGSNTVTALRMMDGSQASQALDSILKHYELRFWTLTVKQKNPQAGQTFIRGDGKRIRAPKFRTYQRPALARIVSARRSRIKLEAPDGTQKTVSLKDLSEADREWIKDWRDRERNKP